MEFARLFEDAPTTALVVLARISAVFTVAWFAARLLRAHPASLRAAVWRAAFVAAALVPFVSACLPSFGRCVCDGSTSDPSARLLDTPPAPTDSAEEPLFHVVRIRCNAWPKMKDSQQ